MGIPENFCFQKVTKFFSKKNVRILWEGAGELKKILSVPVSSILIIPSEARPKAEPGSNGGPKAWGCDLGAKRSGIGTKKVNKIF